MQISNYPRWKRKQLWTLIEAAYLLAGMEPQPPDRFDKNLTTGGFPAEIYDALKDAIDLKQIAFIESRDPSLQNRRVKPADAVVWATKQGYEVPSQMGDLSHSSRDKPLTATERNTLIIIITALCASLGIEHQERGAAVKIAKLTDEIGTPVTDDTIRKVLMKIPDALESRMK